MAKAQDAFRTISEVAEWLDTPTHVLRFWESKFSQIKPVKGAGGRRYYRPADMALLGGIKKLLHEDGLTIKGTQKLLREQGVKYVATLAPSMAAPAPQVAKVAPPPLAKVEPTPQPVVEAAQTPPPIPVAADAPSQHALPFDDPTPPPPAFTIDMPPLPADFPAAAPRLIGLIPTDTTALVANAARIAPLLARLDAVRARMRG